MLCKSSSKNSLRLLLISMFQDMDLPVVLYILLANFDNLSFGGLLDLLNLVLVLDDSVFDRDSLWLSFI